MKVEDVPEEWMALADTVLVPGKPLSKNDLRAALAAVIPTIQAEALERAAVVADNRHLQWEFPHPADARPGEVCDDATACTDIAAAIRALKEGT